SLRSAVRGRVVRSVVSLRRALRLDRPVDGVGGFAHSGNGNAQELERCEDNDQPDASENCPHPPRNEHLMPPPFCPSWSLVQRTLRRPTCASVRRPIWHPAG